MNQINERLVYDLYVYYDGTDEEVRAAYKEQIRKRNEKIDRYLTESRCPSIDSGFDLYVPETLTTHAAPETLMIPGAGFCTTLVDHKISCAMYFGGIPCGFHMYARSSISKLHCRLANSVGIIDASYRGHIIAALDVRPGCSQKLDKLQRVVQWCSPNMTYPIRVTLVDSPEDLGSATERGEGGFGSTGI